VSVLLFAMSVGAQPVARPALRAGGTDVFRALFGVERLEPVRSAAGMDVEDLGRLIVVFLGPPRRSEAVPDPAGLSVDVLFAGGSVLIATDEPADLSAFFPGNPPIAVTGQLVTCTDPADGSKCFRNDPLQPFAVPSPVGPELIAGWEVFGGLRRVATNGPSSLIATGDSPYISQVFARFPLPGKVGGPAGRRLVKDDDLLAVGGAADITSGLSLFRSLVVADPGVFINQSLAAGTDPQTGTDNLAFALRTVRWLRGPEPERRTHCLFVDHGMVRETFDDLGLSRMSSPLPPMPPLPSPLDPKVQAFLTDSANGALARIEDSNWANRMLAGEPGDDRKFGKVLKFLAWLAAVAAAVWLLSRSRTTRHAPDLPPPPRELGAGADIPVGSVAYRRAELVRTGHLTEPVRDYVRTLFAGCGLATVAVGDAVPPFEATGPAAGDLRRDVRTVWAAVFGPAAPPITAVSWKELEPMVDAIRRAAAAGRLRFPAGGSA
ncbi:MAG: hypothetical protein ACRC7O_18060, partial [Fimbriiglobus sp.]